MQQQRSPIPRSHSRERNYKALYQILPDQPPAGRSDSGANRELSNARRVSADRKLVSSF
jgi:hypothetical protein